MDADSTRAPDGATDLTTKNDAAILAAWERFAANRKAVGELREETPGYEAKEERLWAAVHADEVFIGESTAKTLLGVEIQLWCIVSHDVPQWEWELAVFRRDISAFDGLDEHLDWSTRVALQAIRSLRAMGGEA
ncbi:hypothetical protein ATE67_10145 [Sphingopyxis sp. H050]|jgi:hypothetical protein|uniref:hypothetical protein n=1 Tax=Sphingopyxis sp. H050 TaxID=1759072 RepID=UPI00073682B0|nr:hypothetical protein [Sphingopyxis sp. H050]KTE20597.1 hypothetical protein ATE67_10145 [Sphingopyxis sp. H050]